MKALTITLSVVALLVLAAHFMRASNPILMLLSLGFIGGFSVRRPGVRRALQVALALGAVQWVWIAMNLAEVRLRRGEPWERMAIILSCVAVLTGVAALLLESKAMKAHFDGRSRAPARDAESRKVL
jgi:hypothetical protein